MIAATNADIVIGTESWLKKEILSSQVFPQSFKHYRKDRAGTNQGGGVFILINDRFTSDEPEELKTDGNDKLLWCKIKIIGQADLYVGAFYRPPSSRSPDSLDDIRRSLDRIPSSAHTWLSGDFNLPDIDWVSESPMNSATHMTVIETLFDIARDNFLVQAVTAPTRITEFSSSMLDLFFTNNISLVTKCEVIPGLGDHEAVFIESSLRPERKRLPPRKIYRYNKADYVGLKEELANITPDFLASQTNSSANESWDTFVGHLKRLQESMSHQK